MRTNTILAALAVVLAVPTALTVLAEQRSFIDFERVPHLFEGLNPDNVHYIVLARTKKKAADAAEGAAPEAEEQDELVFARTQDGWMLGQSNEHPNPLVGVPVQEHRIESDILERLQEIRLDGKATVATGVPEEELEKKGLTPDTGITISLRNSEQKAIAELVRGNDASNAQAGEDKVRGFYVRPKDRTDIVLYEPSTPYWPLTIKANDWIDLEMHRFQSRDVKSFSLRNASGEVTFTRGNKQGDFADWQKEGDEPKGVGAVRVQEVTNLLQRFNTVSCTRFIGRVDDQRYAADVPDTKSAEVAVSATLEDGTRYVMLVGKKVAGKQEYFARFEGKRGQSPFLVAIGEWMRSPFERDPKDLFDPPAPPSEGSTPPGEQQPAEQPGKTGEAGGAPPDEGGKQPSPAAPAEGQKQEGAPKASGG